MKRLAFALAMSAIILTGLISTAQATTIGTQPAILDHLVCYTMKDPLTLQTSTDLLAELQPEFSQQGCILVKPIEFCVPAAKRNTNPQPVDPNIVGQSLSNDFICYRAKCKKPVPPPDKEVIDQFGERLQQNYQMTKVCVPAQKRPPQCGHVKGTTGPCLGACPFDVNGLQQVCDPKSCSCISPKPCSGRPDAAGLCTGTCLDPTEQCVLSPQIINSTTGKTAVICSCQPPPSACGLDPATGACGGKCLIPTDQCVFNSAGQCTCEPESSPCQATGNASAPCGGTCPPNTAGIPQTCIPVTGSGTCANGKCVGSNGTPCTTNADCKVTCTCDPPLGCSQNALTGQCGGTCDTGYVCSLDTTGHCGCSPTPCGSVTTSTGVACGGACPTGDKCAADATGACNCQPPTNPDPCLNSTTCNPVPCPSNQICSIVAGTNVCRCQCEASSCGTCPVGQTCSLVAGATNCACQ